MALSSDTLFHFTSSIENLRSILEHEFRPSYCLEEFSFLDPGRSSDGVRFAIPMVSFCDIPLSQVRSHMGVYGAYGVGLAKVWGMRAGVSPVLYTYRGSPLPTAMNTSLMWTPGNGEDGDDYGGLWDSLFHITCFMKPYEGSFSRGGRRFDKVRFYDEREWRYVVPQEDSPNPYGLDAEAYADLHKRSAANDRLRADCRLPFEPSDITYIIVAAEAEILPMIREIERLKSPKYSPDQIKILSSRIVSAERIAGDF